MRKVLRIIAAALAAAVAPLVWTWKAGRWILQAVRPAPPAHPVDAVAEEAAEIGAAIRQASTPTWPPPVSPDAWLVSRYAAAVLRGDTPPDVSALSPRHRHWLTNLRQGDLRVVDREANCDLADHMAGTREISALTAVMSEARWNELRGEARRAREQAEESDRNAVRAMFEEIIANGRGPYVQELPSILTRKPRTNEASSSARASA